MPIQMITELIETHQRLEMIDITLRIEQLLATKAVRDGFVIIQVPHTTAAVTVNEHADPDVKHDLLAKLSALVPHIENYYLHDEGNSDAHVKAALVGSTATLIIEAGKLVLGRWQGIFFCEFDGPRERHVNVKFFATGG